MSNTRQYYKHLICHLYKCDNYNKILLDENIVNYLGEFSVNMMDYFFINFSIDDIKKSLLSYKDFNELAKNMIIDGDDSISNYNNTIISQFITINDDHTAFTAGCVESVLKDILLTTSVCEYGMEYTSEESIKKYIQEDPELNVLFTLVNTIINEISTTVDNICRLLYDLYDVPLVLDDKYPKYIDAIKNTEKYYTDTASIQHSVNIPIMKLIHNYLYMDKPDKSSIVGLTNNTFFSKKFTKNITLFCTDRKSDNNFAMYLEKFLDSTPVFIDFYFDNDSPIGKQRRINSIDEKIKNVISKPRETSRIHNIDIYLDILPKFNKVQNPYYNIITYIASKINTDKFPIKVFNMLQFIYSGFTREKFSSLVMKILSDKSMKNEYQSILKSMLSLESYTLILNTFYTELEKDTFFQLNINKFEQVIKTNQSSKDYNTAIITICILLIKIVFTVYKISLIFQVHDIQYNPLESFNCVIYTDIFCGKFLQSAFSTLGFQ